MYKNVKGCAYPTSNNKWRFHFTIEILNNIETCESSDEYETEQAANAALKLAVRKAMLALDFLIMVPRTEEMYLH